MRVEIKKNKETKTYSLYLHFSEITLSYHGIDSKEEAEHHRDEVNATLDKNSIKKLRLTLKDTDIGALSYQIYPLAQGFLENMVRDAMRKEFIKTAKTVRGILMDINLNKEEEKDYEEE